MHVWKSWKQEGRGAWSDNATMEKSEEETLEVSFSSRKRKGMYIYQKEVKNKIREKRLKIVPISLLQCASNTPWVFKQVCNLQIPQIFKVPSSLPSFLMELSSCDKVIWSCFYSFSHIQSFPRNRENHASQARTWCQAHCFQCSFISESPFLLKKVITAMQIMRAV